MKNKGKISSRLLIVVLLLMPLVAGAEVYKWTDAFGKVHYSDKPHEATDKPIDLPESMIYKAPAKPKFKLDKPQTKTAYKFYQSFKIVSPQNDGTVRSAPGNLSVFMQVSPALRANHSVVVMVDGKQVAKGKSTSVSASNIDRGSHSLSAKVVDESGKTIMSASVITFHMKR